MKVISKDTIYSYLEEFLDANLTKTIGNFNNGTTIATEFTEETKHHFDTKISSLEAGSEIHSALQKKLFTIEEQLAMHFKGADTSSKEFLEETLSFIHTQVTGQLPEGLFLTEEGAKSILQNCRLILSKNSKVSILLFIVVVCSVCACVINDRIYFVIIL